MSIKNYVHNAVTLSSGTVTAQIVGVLAAPLLTRLYSPSEFGAFAIYLNIVMIISVISCLRYESTIPLVRQTRTALLLVILCALIAGILSVGLWVPIIAFEGAIQTCFGFGVANRLLLLLPVSFALTALYRIASNWAVRNKDYMGLSLSKLWQSLPQTAGQISFGLLHFGMWGLVIGEIIGRLLGLLALIRRSHKVFGGTKLIYPRRMLTLLSYYKDYPLYSTWSALMNEAGSAAPVFFLAAIYGPETAGLIALVQRIFAAPMDLISQTALTMYMGEASQALRNDLGQLHSIFLKVFFSLLALAIFPTALLVWRGPELFDALFGHAWSVAGTYAQIVAVAYGIRMAVSPISQTLQILGRQKLILLIEISRLLGILCVFAGGHLLKLETETVLSWYSGVLTLSQLWILFVTWAITKSVRT